MALIFIDGFDHYSTADISKKWAGFGGGTVNSSGGRRSGGCYVASSNSSTYLIKAFANSATVVAGCAFYLPSISGGGHAMVMALGDGGSAQLTLAAAPDGTLKLWQGAINNVLLGTGPVLAIGTWYYIEIKATISDSISAGACVVRVNGVAAITLAAGADTKATGNAYANQLWIGQVGSSGNSQRVDDLYLCDTSGSVNNDFLGDCRVDALYPNADGAYSSWAPSTGTAHWSLVDETAPNATDYVSASTVGAKDSYAFTDLTAPTVFGVQVNNYAWKDDAGGRSIANLVRSGGVDAQGAGTALATTPLYLSSVHETDPATSTAWTQAGINAAEFGSIVTA
jgi:hypothetical protein